MGCSSWLVESQRFSASLHGIYNRRCYLLAPRCFRINRRSAASDGKTNSACPARRAHSYGRSLQRLPLCGKQSTDRKSTRLNSSHLVISYAVFCLKKKKMSKSTPKHEE